MGINVTVYTLERYRAIGSKSFIYQCCIVSVFTPPHNTEIQVGAR